jgi:hypothetical protein
VLLQHVSAPVALHRGQFMVDSRARLQAHPLVAALTSAAGRDGIHQHLSKGRVLPTGGRRGLTAGWSTPPRSKTCRDGPGPISRWGLAGQVAERGMCRPSSVQPPEIRRLRDLTRYRRALVQDPTREQQLVESFHSCTVCPPAHSEACEGGFVGSSASNGSNPDRCHYRKAAGLSAVTTTARYAASMLSAGTCVGRPWPRGRRWPTDPLRSSTAWRRRRRCSCRRQSPRPLRCCRVGPGRHSGAATRLMSVHVGGSVALVLIEIEQRRPVELHVSRARRNSLADATLRLTKPAAALEPSVR